MMDEQPKTRWQRIKAAVADHHNQTMIGFALRDSTPEQWAEIRKTLFDDGKRLSDFIGMLVRLGFLYLAMLYLFQMSKEEGVTFRGVILGMAAVFVTGLYAKMIYYIYGIVSAYFASDTSHWKTTLGKLPIVIIGLAETSIFVYGVSTLAHAIAKSSSIVHQ